MAEAAAIVQSATQSMLGNAKTEAEQIVQGATQRANDFDTNVEAAARNLAERITEQLTTFIATIEDSTPTDSAKRSAR